MEYFCRDIISLLGHLAPGYLDQPPLRPINYLSSNHNIPYNKYGTDKSPLLPSRNSTDKKTSPPAPCPPCFARQSISVNTALRIICSIGQKNQADTR